MSEVHGTVVPSAGLGQEGQTVMAGGWQVETGHLSPCPAGQACGAGSHAGCGVPAPFCSSFGHLCACWLIRLTRERAAQDVAALEERGNATVPLWDAVNAARGTGLTDLTD